MWSQCRLGEAVLAKREALPAEAGDCRIIVREQFTEGFLMRKDYLISEQACVDACWTWKRSADRWEFECSWNQQDFSPVAPRACAVGTAKALAPAPAQASAPAEHFTSREACARTCLRAREKEPATVCRFGGDGF